MKTKHLIIPLSTYFLLYTLFSLHAAVPQRWTVETSSLKPVVFDVVRGETLALEASFQSYGTPLATSNMTAFIAWQTNGMSSAWWVTNAVTSGNSASVLFTPYMDPGAPVVNAFIGLSDSTNLNTQTLKNSKNYRAAVTLRFRHGPGETPNVIDMPPRILDLANTVVINPKWPTKAEFAETTTVMRAELKTYIDGQISGAGLVTPTMTTNISSSVVSNVVTKAFVEELGIESGLDTNAVQSIIHKNIDTNLLCTVEAARGMTNDEHIVRGTVDRGIRDIWNISVQYATDSNYSSYSGEASRAQKAEEDYYGNVIDQYYAPLSTTLSGYGIADAYTKTQIDGTTVTNGGAKAYADGKFLPMESQYQPGMFIRWEENGLWVDTDSHLSTVYGDNFSVSGGGKFEFWPYESGMYDDGEKLMFYRGGKNSFITPDNSEVLTKNLGDGYYLGINGQLQSDWNQTNTSAKDYIKNKPSLATVATSGSYDDLIDKPTAQSLGAYPNASGQQLASQVATQGAHLNAEDAQFVSTNYDSAVNMPEAYVRIKLQQGGTNVWQTIWEEMRRWNAFTGIGFNWQTWGGFHAWSTNVIALIDATSQKEYAFYDGVTGDVAPDGFFWISQPRIAICAGASYQRYLDSGNAVWILESNGLAANIGGTTNGYFRISDEEGNTQFEIIKGDKQTVPALSRSITSTNVMGVTHWYSVYAVTNALAAPTAKFCRNLSNQTWIADTEASCPCNVTWTPGVNTYTLEFWPKSTEPTMFCKAEYDRGGETRIRQAVPVEMSYIILNGTKYGVTPKTVNGELVLGLTTGN